MVSGRRDENQAQAPGRLCVLGHKLGKINKRPVLASVSVARLQLAETPG